MKDIRLGLGLAFAAVWTLSGTAADSLAGNELWGGRKAHPAVVNSVTANPNDPFVLSLRGTWEYFKMRSSNQRNTPWSDACTGGGRFWSGKPQWDGTVIPIRPIQVPGCWEQQFAGDSVTTGRSWFCRWDASPLAIRGYHCGDVWYRRYVRLPDGWKGRRIWLKTGWTNSQGFFWVNGEQVAMDANYCATYKYEITDIVRFGTTNCIVVQVNNEAPSHRGCANSKNHWGGILRDIELEATPGTFIDDAWVRGDFDSRTARVEVELEMEKGEEKVKGNGQGQERRGNLVLRATVEGVTKEIPVLSTPTPTPAPTPSSTPTPTPTSTPTPSTYTYTTAIRLANFRPWSPEHPNLYTAKVELVEKVLAGGQGRERVLQTRYERFGVRKLEIRGREVFLNNQPLYLRGAGWHEIDPINGYPKPDRAAWLKRVRQVRAAGFNIVRNHTHCKMPEFYEACDEAGLMIEAELPYYGDVASDGQRFDPPADAEMLYRHFRRYPSFAIYSFGNEGSFGPFLSKRLYSEVKARDPDRLVVGQDGGDGPRPANYRGTSDFAGGPSVVTARNSFRPELPFFFHEYVNSSVKLDSRVADGFTGVWAAPISRASRQTFLAPFGLDLAWGDRLQNAQNRMQKTYLKYGLECARLEPAGCGYSYWSLQDACSPQGDTFIGQALWDPFWGEKRFGSSTADVAVYNSPSCVLLTDGADIDDYSKHPELVPSDPGEVFFYSTLTNLVRTSGDTIKARFHFAHYGDAPLRDAHLDWKLLAGDRTLASGTSAIGAQALGVVRQVGAADIVVPPLAKPVEARLVATVRDGVFSQSNAWTYWLFPPRRTPDASAILCDESYRAALAPRYPKMRFASDAAKADFSSVRAVIAPFGSELEKRALAAGKSVVALANQKTPRNIVLGWWYMTEQMGAALVDHPALAGLPHDGLFEPLFFRVGREGLPLPVAGFAKDDYVMVGEGGKGCYLYLAIAKRPNGARHGLIAGLDVLADTVEGSAILDGFLNY